MKKEKTYKFWKALACDILRRRGEDAAPIVRHVEVAPENPKNLAPNIAMRAPPATAELMEAKLSRFKTK